MIQSMTKKPKNKINTNQTQPPPPNPTYMVDSDHIFILCFKLNSTTGSEIQKFTIPEMSPSIKSQVSLVQYLVF